MAMAPFMTPSRTMATPVMLPPGLVTRIFWPLPMPSRAASSRLIEIGLCGCAWRRRSTAMAIELIRFDLYEVIRKG